MFKSSLILAGLLAVGAQAAFGDAPAIPRFLTIVDTELGLVLANKDDRTVYTFDRDQGDVSACYNQCAVAWPAVLTTKTALTAPFGLTPRTDGTSQVTFNGHPLYLYKFDEAAGDVNGDGSGGVWHVAKLGG